MNSKATHLVVTGATGFVGRHFLHWLLREDESVTVTLLVRGETITGAKQRFLRLLAQVAKDYAVPFEPATVSQRCEVVLADITKPMCGLSAEQLESLGAAEKSTFWHLAASLNFEESQKARIESHNIAGTIAAIEVAQALKCEHFVYVSTAYTCGQQTGNVAELLHSLNGPFGNAYERSKCLAEHTLVERCSAANLDYRILRPSIVVGLSTSHMPAGAETGLYGFARELLRMKRAFRQHAGPIRVEGDSKSEVNLVPVDFVAKQMVNLHRKCLPPGPVFHLTATEGPTVKELTDAVTDAVGVPRFHHVGALPDDASALERILSRRMAFYGCYLKHSKRFVSRLHGAPKANQDAVRRYVDCYLREREADRLAMIERTIHARDGFPLHVARNERAPQKLGKETVVVVNAVGMPHATLEKLVSTLSATYDVITWESRGVPCLDGQLDHTNAGFARHVDDLEDVLQHAGIDRAHVLGWCTGADVALAFLARSPERVLSLGCLNGGFVRLTGSLLPYQRNLERIARRVSRSATYAQLYHTLMTNPESNDSAYITFDSGIASSVTATMACLDKHLMHLTGAPLQSPEMLQRYCRLLEHYFDEAPNRVPAAPIPTFFSTAENDSIAPMAATLLVASQFRRAQVHIAPNGGHFAPCTSDEVVDAIVGFLAAKSSVEMPIVYTADACSGG